MARVFERARSDLARAIECGKSVAYVLWPDKKLQKICRLFRAKENPSLLQAAKSSQLLSSDPTSGVAGWASWSTAEAIAAACSRRFCSTTGSNT